MKAHKRASKFLSNLSSTIKAFDGPCIIVLAESEEKSWRGTDTYKLMHGGREAVLKKIKWWLGQCRPVPSAMTFDVVSKRGITWLLSWHSHD